MKRLASLALVLAGCAGSPKPPAEKPLYERLGGAHAIAAVVDSFVDRLFLNATVMSNPVVKEESGKVSRAGLKVQLSALVCQVTGGPHKYQGRSMPDSHTGLNISEKEWDAMAGEFKVTLDAFKVPEKEQKELFDIVGSVKGDVVKGPKTSGPRTPMPKPQGDSLYARLGGVYGIAAVVDEFVVVLGGNATVGANKTVVERLGKIPKAATVFQVTLYLSYLTGGPHAYVGKPLKEAHKDLGITGAEWDAAIADLRKVLDKFKVPSREQKELVDLIQGKRGDVVTR